MRYCNWPVPGKLALANLNDKLKCIEHALLQLAVPGKLALPNLDDKLKCIEH